MNKLKTIFGSVAALLLLGVGAYIGVFLHPTSAPKPGSLAGPDIPSSYLQWGGVYEGHVSGSCNTASSTLFAIQSPFNATSTLVYFGINGTQGATTSDMVVATSTVASPAYTTTTATSSLNENILGAQIAASAQFQSVAGVTLGSDTGYTNPALKGFVSNSAVSVGTNDYVIGFSTSTAPGGAGGRGAGQVSVPSSCTYDAIFVRGF